MENPDIQNTDSLRVGLAAKTLQNHPRRPETSWKPLRLRLLAVSLLHRGSSLQQNQNIVSSTTLFCWVGMPVILGAQLQHWKVVLHWRNHLRRLNNKRCHNSSRCNNNSFVRFRVVGEVPGTHGDSPAYIENLTTPQQHGSCRFLGPNCCGLWWEGFWQRSFESQWVLLVSALVRLPAGVFFREFRFVVSEFLQYRHFIVKMLCTVVSWTKHFWHLFHWVDCFGGFLVFKHVSNVSGEWNQHSGSLYFEYQDFPYFNI